MVVTVEAHSRLLHVIQAHRVIDHRCGCNWSLECVVVASVELYHPAVCRPYVGAGSFNPQWRHYHACLGTGAGI